MISSLRGTLESISLDRVVLDVHGLGFEVFTTPETLGGLRTGAEASLATTLVVREDSMTLYGFTDRDSRDVFLTLQTVSGVGPKLAMGILSELPPEELRRAVSDEDLAALQRVPGVGKKSAQRLVLELAGKLGEPSTAAPAAVNVDENVVEALVHLGWASKDATAAVAAVAAGRQSTADILRAALQYLGASHG